MREDMRAGVIATAFINTQIDPKKHSAYEWFDIFKEWQELATEQSEAAKIAKLEMYFSSFAEKQEG